MPTPARVAALVAMVEAGGYVEAIEAFYAEDATAQENLGRILRGRTALVENERAALTRNNIVARKGSIALVDGDQVAIRWVFEMTDDAGTTRVLDEIAWQRWDGDRIVEERFYYDPSQMR
ncbi:MAG: nuclear transport factor 2 family protein [Caulobacter sp.]|nr:nuclear transport factor 2 family protein [Caulobacter sp.]